MANTVHAQVEGFFDPATNTVSYLVLDTTTGQCALIDSVLDYDPKSGHTATRSADKLIARVRELGANVQWILETHVHADHLTAAPYLKEQLGGQIGIGMHITTVQQVFGKLFNAGADMARDGIDIACGRGALRLRVVQREGGKAITAADYLNARRDLAVGA